jgi:phosphonate transport system substrate-binding protein
VAKPTPCLRLLLPPSSASLAEARRELLATYLREATSLVVEVAVAESYDALTTALLSGTATGAWAPPFSCARLEKVGVSILLRAVRDGHGTYRAALVARAGTTFGLDQLARLRAAWVDPQSTGGYLLVAALLRARGFNLDTLFSNQAFLGSYQAALGAVLAGQADVTSAFGPPAAGQGGLRLNEFAPGRADALRVVAWTDEAPTDGIALGPLTSPTLASALSRALLRGWETPAGRLALEQVFNTSRFEASPPQAYRALHQALRTVRTEG